MQFSIGQMSFTLQSLQSTFTVWLGLKESIPLWVFGIFIFLTYSPLAWVRTVEFFSKAFVLSMFLIFTAVITTSVYCFSIIENNDGEPGPEYVPLNNDSYLLMVGFAFFMFEGIGCLMPVMKETAVPEKFGYITAAALISLCTMYILFASLCYYAWGDNLDQTVVTEMLPADNTFVQVMKLSYVINLVFSYPLCLVPAHDTFQQYCFGTSKTGSLTRPGERALYWKVNILRSLILLTILVITIYVADVLDKVISVAGAVFGMTNVLLFPSICHLKILAKNKCAKVADICIIIFACFMIVFGPATILMQSASS